jgi:hypothetical protein
MLGRWGCAGALTLLCTSPMPDVSIISAAPLAAVCTGRGLQAATRSRRRHTAYPHYIAATLNLHTCWCRHSRGRRRCGCRRGALPPQSRRWRPWNAPASSSPASARSSPHASPGAQAILMQFRMRHWDITAYVRRAPGSAASAPTLTEVRAAEHHRCSRGEGQGGLSWPDSATCLPRLSLSAQCTMSHVRSSLKGGLPAAGSQQHVVCMYICFIRRSLPDLQLPS